MRIALGKTLTQALAAVPPMVFPMFPPWGRRVALIPAAGTIIACWAAGYLHSGWPVAGIFTNLLRVILGLAALVGLRLGFRALVRRCVAVHQRGESVEQSPDAFGIALLAFFGGAAVIGLLAGADRPDEPAGLAIVGCLLWLIHELAFCRWYYLCLRQQHGQAAESREA